MPGRVRIVAQVGEPPLVAFVERSPRYIAHGLSPMIGGFDYVVLLHRNGVLDARCPHKHLSLGAALKCAHKMLKA